MNFFLLTSHLLNNCQGKIHVRRDALFVSIGYQGDQNSPDFYLQLFLSLLFLEDKNTVT